MVEEKTFYGSAPVYLSFVPASEYVLIADSTPTSVHCLPVKGDEIMFTQNPRGLDIIGGHIEKGETPEDALHREAMEEAYITLNKFKLIGAVRVDNRDNPKATASGYPPIGYQLFYAVTDYTLTDFKADFECTERVYVKQSDIKDRHHHWLKTHDEILTAMNGLLKNTNKIKFRP